MHGLDFHALPAAARRARAGDAAPAAGLVSAARCFRLERPETWLHCVSASQQASCPPSKALLPFIANGVPLERLQHAGRASAATRWHWAASVRRRAITWRSTPPRAPRVPLVLAGELFRYRAHEEYFAQRDPAAPADGARPLHRAGGRGAQAPPAGRRALPARSQPGAGNQLAGGHGGAGVRHARDRVSRPARWREIVEHGRTGFLVDDEREMAEAIARGGRHRSRGVPPRGPRALFRRAHGARSIWDSTSGWPRSRPHADGGNRSCLFEIEELTATPELEALAPEWDALWERLPAATPFQSPAWLLPWWRHCSGGGKLWALALRRTAGWRAWRRCSSTARRGAPGRRARRGHHRLPGCADRARIGRRGAHCCSSTWRAPRPVGRLQFSGPAAGLAHAGAARRRRTGMRDRTLLHVCPVIPLPGTWEELAARCLAASASACGAPAAARKDRRALRRRRGRRRWTSSSRPCSACTRRAGRAREEPGMLADERAARVPPRGRAGKCCGAGMLRLYGLRCRRRAWLAVLYGFAAHGRFYAYLSGFDPALERLSPGTVLLAMAIERSIAGRLARVRFPAQARSRSSISGARRSRPTGAC